MNDDEIARRRRLTFAQAEGRAPLPSQLKRTDVTPELRAVLWRFIHDEITRATTSGGFGSYVGSAWGKILRNVHVLHYHRFTDDFSAAIGDVLTSVRTVFEKGDYLEMYGWLQFVLQHQPPLNFANQLQARLKYCRTPYRIVGGDVLCPVGSDLDAVIIDRAIQDVTASSLSGAREHMKTAVAEVTAGHFADSVRESIHSVESVVRVLEPSGDFSKALYRLEQKTRIHGAMKQGFLNLYGFTSDEQGIRHPLLERKAPSVDEADALFMIGACSAFLSYLVNKARAAGLLVAK
jgi:hypothetical protein